MAIFDFPFTREQWESLKAAQVVISFIHQNNLVLNVLRQILRLPTQWRQSQATDGEDRKREWDWRPRKRIRSAYLMDRHTHTRNSVGTGPMSNQASAFRRASPAAWLLVWSRA
jgi:hypothetical protein